MFAVGSIIIIIIIDSSILVVLFFCVCPVFTVGIKLEQSLFDVNWDLIFFFHFLKGGKNGKQSGAVTQSDSVSKESKFFFKL